MSRHQQAERARLWLERHPDWIDALVTGQADEIDEAELCEEIGCDRVALAWGVNRAIRGGF